MIAQSSGTSAAPPVSPKTLELRRRALLEQMAAALSTKPVAGGWVEGLARVGTAGLLGYQEGQLDQQERAAQKPALDDQAEIAKWLAGRGSSAAPIASGAPATGSVQQVAGALTPPAPSLAPPSPGFTGATSQNGSPAVTAGVAAALAKPVPEPTPESTASGNDLMAHIGAINAGQADMVPAGASMAGARPFPSTLPTTLPAPMPGAPIPTNLDAVPPPARPPTQLAADVPAQGAVPAQAMVPPARPAPGKPQERVPTVPAAPSPAAVAAPVSSIPPEVLAAATRLSMSQWADPGQRAFGQTILQHALKEPPGLNYQTDKAGNIIALDPTGKRQPQVVYRAEVDQNIERVEVKRDGEDVTMFLDKRSGRLLSPEQLGAPAAPAAPQNPYAMRGKATEDERKSAGYANRTVESHVQINELEQFGLGAVDKAYAALPGGNYLISEGKQKLLQAQRNFTNAVLRRESGAVISAEEFASAAQQYFPQPGDTPAVIAQKRANRETTIEGLMGSAGRGYAPPPAYKRTPAAPAGGIDLKKKYGLE